MKRVLSLIVVLAMVLAMVPAVFAADATIVASGMATKEADGKFTVMYTPDVDGVLTVTVGDGNADWVSDIMNFTDFSVTDAVTGPAQTSYTLEVTGGTSYSIRIYGHGDPTAAISNIPYTITFTASEEEGTGELITSGSASCTHDAATDSYVPQNVKVTAPGNGTMLVKLSAPINTDAKQPEWYCEAVSVNNPAHQAADGTYRFDVFAGYEYTLGIGVYDAYEDSKTPPEFAAGKVPYEVYFLAGDVELKDFVIVAPAFNVSSDDAGETVINGEGSYTVTLDPTAKVTIFEFKTPGDGNGTYQFTAADANAEVTYWGPTAAAPSQQDKEDGVAQNVVSATVSNGQWVTNIPMDSNGKPIEGEAYDTWESSSILVGISGISGDVTLTVVKTASLPNVEQDDTEDADYVNVHTFPDGFHNLSESAKVQRVDVTEAHTAVLGADGYYHLDTVDGPVLYVDTETSYCSLSALTQGDWHMNTTYVNAEGVSVKENMKSAMAEYVAAADENGLYPMTVDLEIFLKYYGWQDVSNLPYDAETVNKDTAWMALCRYEDGSEDAQKNLLTVGQNLVAVPVETVTYTYTAAEAGDFNLTVDSGEAEIYLDGDMVAYLDAEGVIEGELPVTLEADDEVSVFFTVFDDNGDLTAGNVIATVEFKTASSQVEPDGTAANPYIIDEAPVTFDAVVAEDYTSVFYKFDATKAGAISDNAPEGAFVYYYINGEMVSAYPDPVTYQAGDEVKVEVYAWTAGTYEITLKDPSVAKIGDVVYTDLSEALDAANASATAAAPVTIVLVADAHEEKSHLSIDENVTLDMGAFDVYAKSLNVLTGGKLSGVEYKQGADWAMIHLPSASRMVMSGIVVKNDGSIGAIPVWDDDASCYVFGGAFFRSSNYIVAIDETAKSISFKFFPSLRTDLMKGYFQDANEMRDNGLRLVLRLTWPGADENGDINGEAQQDFVYSSEFVKVFMEKLGSARFTFLLTGYDTMITDEALAEMTITPMIIADNGMVFAGETVEVADYLQ